MANRQRMMRVLHIVGAVAMVLGVACWIGGFLLMIWAGQWHPDDTGARLLWTGFVPWLVGGFTFAATLR